MAELPRVGFIGLGDLGAPMARRLQRCGFPLTIWARRPDTIAAFAEPAAAVASDPAALGAAADVVALCVGYDAQLREVLLAAGLLAAMRPGTAVLVHSTVHPDTVRALDAEAGARGVALIDAPISGGSERAASGELTLMIGCEPAALEPVRAVLEALGEPLHLGPVGAGQTAKIINNTLMSANIGASAAALETAGRMGLDPDVFARVLAGSSGQSTGLAILTARMAAARAGAVGVRPAILAKDIGHFADIRPASPAPAALEVAARRGLEAMTLLVAEGRPLDLG